MASLTFQKSNLALENARIFPLKAPWSAGDFPAMFEIFVGLRATMISKITL